MKRLLSVVGAGALMLGTMTGMATAQGPGRHGRDHMQFMATALDLTDAQQAQIKQIRGEGRTKNQADRQQTRGLHEQLKALIASDSFDEAKAQTLIAQIQQIRSAEMLDHAREMNAIYKVLTPQQKAKAVKLFESRHERGQAPAASTQE